MKLLTVNVHAWLEENQLEKIDILARTIAEKNYDIIALQEVNQLIDSASLTRELHVDNYGIKLLELLERYTNEKYSYFWSISHIGYDKYEEGIAFLTKLPVYEVDPFYCSTHQTLDSILSRKILGLSIHYKGQLIDVYSCHINLPDCIEENQLDNVAAIVSRSNNNRLKLLMGDFNTDAISNPQAYEAIKSLGLYDSYELAKEKDSGITVSKSIDGWSTHAQEKRLDYIFTNQKNIDIKKSSVIFNGQNQSIISDHFGVEVEIDFK